MTVWSFTLTEYDPDQPWIVISTGRDSIELPNGQDFYAWARERWPSPRYQAKLDPQPFDWMT
jgi:hypothetical protein